MIFIPLTSDLVTHYFRSYPGSPVTLRCSHKLTRAAEGSLTQKPPWLIHCLMGFLLDPCPYLLYFVPCSLATVLSRYLPWPASRLMSLFLTASWLMSPGILSFFSVWFGVAMHIDPFWLTPPCESDKMTGFFFFFFFLHKEALNSWCPVGIR